MAHTESTNITSNLPTCPPRLPWIHSHAPRRSICPVEVEWKPILHVITMECRLASVIRREGLLSGRFGVRTKANLSTEDPSTSPTWTTSPRCSPVHLDGRCWKSTLDVYAHAPHVKLDTLGMARFKPAQVPESGHYLAVAWSINWGCLHSWYLLIHFGIT